MYVCMYHVSIFVYRYESVYICIMFVYFYICMNVCIYVSCLYISIYVCIYVCMYVCYDAIRNTNLNNSAPLKKVE